MKITLPESVKSYCVSRGVRTAINSLSEQDDSYLPDHLDWDELPSYFQSILAAKTVKTDFALLVLQLWDAIWKPALEACAVTKPWMIDDMQTEDTPPSLETLWEVGLYRTHYHPRDENARIDTYIGLAVEQNQLQISLSLASWDAEEEAQEITLSEDWAKEDESWYSATKQAVPAIDPATTDVIDCASLRQLAEQALRQLMDG